MHAPLVASVGGPAYVQRELDVGAGLAGPLAQNELVEQGALAPVDVARIVALAHGSEAEYLITRTTTRDPASAEASTGLVIAQAKRIDCGIDDELAIARDLARFLEK